MSDVVCWVPCCKSLALSLFLLHQICFSRMFRWHLYSIPSRSFPDTMPSFIKFSLWKKLPEMCTLTLALFTGLSVFEMVKLNLKQFSNLHYPVPEKKLLMIEP